MDDFNVDEDFFYDTSYKCIWRTLERAIGNRWNVQGYPIIQLARDAIDKGLADEDILILANQILEE